MRRKNYYELNYVTSGILLLLAIFGTTLLMFLIEPCGLGDLKAVFVSTKFLTFFLNLIPIAALTLALYFATSNVMFAGGLVVLFVTVFSIVNRSKIMIRQSPLYPYDLKLAREVMAIAGNFELKYYIMGVLGTIAFVAAFVVMLRYVRTKKLPVLVRVLGFVITIGATIFLNNTVYAKSSIYNNLHVIGNIYNQVNQFNCKGFVYAFIYNYNTVQLKAPPNYDKQLAEKLTAVTDKPQTATKPHIIMIMGEAFSEMSISDKIDFNGYDDPLAHYKKIKAESISGKTVVPNLGGGTADTEFDALTAMNTRYLRGAPYSFMLVNRDINALPTLLNNIGSNSVAIHPGHPWFYNRQNVYRNFGFSKFISLPDFEGAALKGAGYANEGSTIDRIIQVFEENLPTDKPVFDFCVTIQNHGPYNKIYNATKNFNTTADLTEDEIDALANYYVGLKDADDELNRLVEYLRGRNEPVVLMYYGDHLPGFKREVYGKLLGVTEDELSQLTMYETPYFIWQNDAAKQSTQIEQNYNKLNQKDLRITSNYLGVYLTKLLGFELSDAFEVSEKIMETAPVMLEDYYLDADGKKTPFANASTEFMKDYNLYRSWIYYNMK